MRASSQPNPVSGAALIMSVGHSTRSLQEFLELLKSHGVKRLVDVRTMPRSRRNPQFNREILPGTLEAAGIGYSHLPELGGLRHPRPDSRNTAWRNASFRGYADYMQTSEFAAGLRRLLDLAHKEQVAIMCAEAVPWRCHRSLIADALLARHVRVEHIMSATRRQSHEITPWARVEGELVTYPSGALAGDQQRLPLEDK
jgi:uncharacterized protein (DUF488 family)